MRGAGGERGLRGGGGVGLVGGSGGGEWRIHLGFECVFRLADQQSL